MENVFIPYEKALGILEAYKGDFPEENRALEACTGAYLAEDLLADRDFPPFDRVTMDGIAIVYDTFERGQREFPIESIAPAGTPQRTLQNPAHCIEVMTGAIMPLGVDTVIRYEDLHIEEGKAIIQVDQLVHKQNVHFKGMDRKQGSCIVAKGNRLSSAEINIAASVGKASLKVRVLPRTLIFSTGDELVPIFEQPALHQIRRSNIYGIKNTLQEWGLKADLQHLPDDKEEMHRIISKQMEAYDVLIFTGGVSKGKFDFLPDVLESLQVKKHFHKIQQRPGKPFWFGTNAKGKKIFALPGNPVSSFVCVYVYLRFWLKKSLGIVDQVQHVRLKKDVAFKPDLVYFLEAALESDPDGSLWADPLKGNGSGDFANLVKTDGFLILPQNKSEFIRGEVYPFVSYRLKL
ncbi:molybdopterin molybdotransferase MoeA [Spongiimicrobium salis]|uniref:molybdopterin molybdotransferase MoeA n=1 Tax=Spongiimicrobium salis TaxID=1667022 RepID=UPI00374D1807